MYKNEEELYISPINLYHMMCYSFRDLKSITPEELGEEAFSKIEIMLSMILMHGITRQFRRGLYKEYVEKEGLLPVLRGKIDIQETIRLKTQVSRQIYCHYEEFSEDNIYNQVLKALCLLILQRGRIDILERKQFKRLLISFHKVKDISLDCVSWRKLSYEKNKFHYKMLLQMGYMIFKGIHMDPVQGVRYLDEGIFERFYKNFIGCFFATECDNIRVSYEKIADHEEVASDIILHREEGLLIHTYLNLDSNNQLDVSHQKIVIVIEIKKMLLTLQGNNNMLRGIVKGVLLYPSFETNPIQVYQFEKYSIYVKAIDLRQSITYIKNELKEISQLV